METQIKEVKELTLLASSSSLAIKHRLASSSLLDEELDEVT